MKSYYITLLLLCIFSISKAQRDSTVNATQVDHSIAFTTFPTIEYGALYKYHLYGYNFRMGGYFRPNPVNRRPLTNRVQLPHAVNDTAIFYRDSVEKHTKADFRIGMEKQFMLHSFIGKNKPRFVFTAGLDLFFGNSIVEKTYSEGYVKYTTDTLSGITYYLDEDGNPVEEAKDAFGYNTTFATSRWKYSRIGAAPVFNFRTGGARFPFWFGVQVSFDVTYYQLRREVIDDPWNQHEERERSYVAFEPIMHLMLGLQF